MQRKSILFILITLLSAALLSAQQPQGDDKPLPGKVQRLNRVPVSHEILKVKLPHPKEVTLPNGLTVLVLEQHKLPTVSCVLWIKSGALSDPADLPGLASFTADMLREGTAKRSSAQIASELDDLGATFTADAGFGSNLTTIQASGLSESVDKFLDLMSDIVLNAGFPSTELDRFKRTEKARLLQLRSNPGFLARERFSRAIYGGFPASIQATTNDAIQKVTPESLRGFHDKYYLPGNAILAFAGDITVPQATALATKYFGPWKNSGVAAITMAELPPPSAAHVYVVDRPGSVQSNILAGGLTVRRSDPDYLALSLANRILGGGSAARLFANLREDKGYTYGAYSRVSSDIYPGTLIANTEVRNAVTDGSLHELMYEFRRLRDEKVPSAELEEAKRSIISRFALSLQSPSEIMNAWLTVKYYGLPADYWDRYADEVAKIDADTIQRTAKKYIDLDHLQIVIVGDGKEVREAASKYGAVSVFDAEGKPMEVNPAGAVSGTK
ncbi:MAG TPA: pitrilysin family protein [Candidatus Angelobacter sp.]|nr:pitrilysin family protein [Candidatus Angelobacter sp.]